MHRGWPSVVLWDCPLPRVALAISGILQGKPRLMCEHGRSKLRKSFFFTKEW